MSFATDISTDPSFSASLFSLTCHELSENFEVSSIVLKCETFKDRHTDDIITEKFNVMFTEWNILIEQVRYMIRECEKSYAVSINK